jgi:hypothetical protein
MREIEVEIPLIDAIKVRNPPIPLYDSMWELLAHKAMRIRQDVARPIKDGGLEFTLRQIENTRRGVESVIGEAEYQPNSGLDAWIQGLMSLINLELRGSQQLEQLRLTRNKFDFLIYYGSCYNNRMELVFYIGSREDIDKAIVEHRKRSTVYERNWQLLAQQLPMDIWVKET